MTSIRANSPRVVIIGAGFGELAAARQLAQAPFEARTGCRFSLHRFHAVHGSFWSRRAHGCWHLSIRLSDFATGWLSQ